MGSRPRLRGGKLPLKMSTHSRIGVRGEKVLDPREITDVVPVSHALVVAEFAAAPEEIIDAHQSGSMYRFPRR